jgi:hypothetical protein
MTFAAPKRGVELYKKLWNFIPLKWRNLFGLFESKERTGGKNFYNNR